MKRVLGCIVGIFMSILVSDAAPLSPGERQVLLEVAGEYGLSGEQAQLLLAIRCVEQGASGLEMGVGQDFPDHPARRLRGKPGSLRLQARWAAGTIRSRYTGDLASFARRYCPPNWAWWSDTVAEYMEREL